MERKISRREFAKSLARATSGAALLALQPSCKSLLEPRDTRQLLREDLKDIDGTLLFDEASRQGAADDFGHIVHRVPIAVLNPGSIEDIQKMVRFANRRGVRIALNGNGHREYGQAQVENGVVILSSGLKTIHRIDADSAYVDAGLTWGELLKATLAKGLTPPVLAEFQDLSIGGTLGLGGIGGASHRLGAQIDHVLELDVVTGTGERLICSPERNRELFHAVLAGFGQCALIVRAKVRLVSAPTHVMIQNFIYRDPAVYMEDAARTAREERFDHQLGRVAFEEVSGRPNFRLEAGRFYSAPGKPDLADLAAGLRFDEAAKPVIYTYWDYLNQRTAAARPGKAWQLAHARFYHFLPTKEMEGFLKRILANPSEYAGARVPSLFGVYPLNARHFTCPLFQIPKRVDQFFALYLFRGAPREDSATVQAMVQTNRALYERGRALGGKQFLSGALPFTAADWKDHFGPDGWSYLSRAKSEFDPSNILTPGQGMFGASGT
jgi:cytokinin dehydrogenase